VAKRKPVAAGSEYRTAVPEVVQSESASNQRGARETAVTAFETPEFQWELANFIKVIGDIRSRPLDLASQALDNEDR
jgi:hypothetical protein